MDVESVNYGKAIEMTDEYGRIVDELKEELGLEKVTAQQYAYCFARFFQVWYGCKTPPNSELDLAVQAFEMICMKYQVYALPAMFAQMVGMPLGGLITAEAGPERAQVRAKLREITRSTAQFKLSDTTLGQIALANHDQDVGLEYERKGTVERALIGQVKSAKQLPTFF